MAKRIMEDLVFNQMLCSAGYKVDYAVGTTYSLDLPTFMSLPFSLGFIEDPDEAMRNCNEYLFTALRLCDSKLAVFCNFANIRVPTSGQKKSFYSLIEKSIFTVKVSKKSDEIVNFHPKVWVIQESEINGTGSRIKLIVMSRNLSTDNSLDVVCELTGDIGKNEAPAASLTKHKPLWDFLNYLKKHADERKRAMIEKLIGSLKKVKRFEIDEELFDDYSFHPMGIKGYKGVETLEQIQDSREAMIISPFIDPYTLEGFSEIGNKTLITREMSLSEAIVNQFGKDNIYIMNQQMLDNEESEPVDLHAKIYYSRDRENRQHVHLGSANATWNGFHKNVEFILGLRLAKHKWSYEKFRENFIHDDKDCKFERMICVPEAEDKGKDFDATIDLQKAIVSIREAFVTQDADGTYSVTIISDVGHGKGASIYPLMYPEMKTALQENIVFKNISLENISEFYVIETECLKRLIKIHTKNIPEERDEAICRKLMNKDRFMDCISFLLSDCKKVYVAERIIKERLLSREAGPDGEPYTSTPALYEELIRTAYERPDVFQDMDNFIKSLPGDIIPDDFRVIYTEIKKALKNYTR